MSKNDQLRAMREAKAAAAQKRITRPPTETEKPLVFRAPTAKQAADKFIANAEARQNARAVKKLQALADKTKERLTPHPDCPVCKKRREQTAARMKAARAKK